MPFFYIFASSPWHLLAIEFFSSFAWSGLELAAFNFLLNITPADKRSVYIANHTFLKGIAIVAGTLIGGFAAHAVAGSGFLFMSGLQIIFFISFVNNIHANYSQGKIDINTQDNVTVINNQATATSNSQNGDANASADSSVRVDGDNVSGKISTDVNGQKNEIKIDKSGTYSIKDNNGQVTITQSVKSATMSPTIINDNQNENKIDNQSRGVMSWIKSLLNFLAGLFK